MGCHKTLDIKTVCECNKCLCTETLHPQATLINLEKPDLGSEAVKFEFYAILLTGRMQLLRPDVLRLQQCDHGLSQAR